MLDKTKRYLVVGLGLLGGVAATLIVVLPFAWGENIFTWLVDKYAATLSGYPHATLSTGNLMFLLGGNWVDESTALIGSITYGQIGLVLMALSFAAGVAVYALALPVRRRTFSHISFATGSLTTL